MRTLKQQTFICTLKHSNSAISTTLSRESGSSKTIYNKWKNHFYEMKGDVGMSLHEKERNKKMPT